MHTHEIIEAAHKMVAAILTHAPVTSVRTDAEIAMSHAQRKDWLTRELIGMAKFMGLERFHNTPVALMHQFLASAHANNQSAAHLLQALEDSFMVSYSNQVTHGRARALLEQAQTLKVELWLEPSPAAEAQAMKAAQEALRELIDSFCPSDAPGAGSVDILPWKKALYVMAKPPEGVDFDKDGSSEIKEAHLIWLESLLLLPSDIFGVTIDVRPFHIS